MRLRFLLLALAASVALPVASSLAATFIALGDPPGGTFSSEAYAVSEDGSTVVGRSQSGLPLSASEAFRWTAETGMIGLGDLPGDREESRAFTTSGDGTVVAGCGRSPTLETAFIWTPSTGMDLLWDGFGGCALGATPDASVFVGGKAQLPVRWTLENGLEFLPILRAGGGTGGARSVSADGQIVVGVASSDPGPQAFRWTALEGSEGIGDLPGGSFDSQAEDISGDGSVIVGWGESNLGVEAFRWTEPGGMVRLGDLPGGLFSSQAHGVSADGSVVAGFGSTGLGPEAFIWTAANGLRNLQDFLEDEGGLDLTGWRLKEARDLSGDGLTITGTGINPSGSTEAWLASIEVGCNDGVDGDGDGLTDFLSDTGSDDLSERSPDFPCDDGLDNDSNGVADFPDDWKCLSPWDRSEHRRRCGLGFELALVFPLLVWLRRRRRPSASRLCLVFCVTAPLNLLLAGQAWGQAEFVYLTQDGSSENAIHRVSVEGGTLRTIQASGVISPIGIDVDVVGGKLYWADLDGVIQRKNLDGSGAVETLIDSDVGPFDIALDLQQGKMYFSDRGTPTLDATLKRANLDGSDVETLVAGTVPAYIDLDLLHGKIYYAHGGSGPIFISRANLDGTSPELIYSAATDTVRGIALDLTNQKIYFGLKAQFALSSKISRANLDGSGFEDFLTGLSEQEWPHDLALDREAGRLYWSFSEGIHRVDLDLMGPVETIVSGLQGSSISAGVNGIALDNPPECGDGLDNDGDGMADFPADSGCADADDPSELSVNFACDDGLDNDGDGLTDFPDDPHCVAAWDRSERPRRCGLGFELVLPLQLLIWLRLAWRTTSPSRFEPVSRPPSGYHP